MAKGILQSNSAVMLGKFATVDAPAPQAGAMYFDTTDNKFKFCEDGVNWVDATTGASAEWGNITGTLSDQTDLQDALDLKADVSDLNDYIEKPASPTSGQILSYDGANWIAEDAPEAPVTSVNGQTGDVVLDSDNVSEGASNLYFTDARAKAASVVDSLAGSETDQAPSVAAVKTAIANIDALPDQSGHNGQFLKTDGTDADWSALAISDVTNLQDALDDKISISQKGAVNGIASLDSNGKVPNEQLPAIAVTDTFVVADQSEMLALDAQTGDIAVRTDVSKSFILAGTDPTELSDWQELLTPPDLVQSVNSQTGIVQLDAVDIPYDNSVSGLTAEDVQAAIDEIVSTIPPVGANTTLSNLESPTSVNVPLLPGAGSTLGSLASPWTIYYGSSFLRFSGATRLEIQANGQISPSGLKSNATISGGGSNLGITIYSTSVTGTNNSAAIDIETGNTVNGNSGNINLRPGIPSGSGVRGVVDVTGALISNVLDPVSDQDAATKAYVDANVPQKETIELLASQTDVVISELSYDATEFEGCEILYKLKDSTTGEVKMSRLFIANNDTSASINDLGIDTGSIDCSFDVQINAGNVEVLYTTGTNACVMKCQITKIQA